MSSANDLLNQLGARLGGNNHLRMDDNAARRRCSCRDCDFYVVFFDIGCSCFLYSKFYNFGHMLYFSCLFNPNVSIVKVYNVFLSGNSIIFTFNSFLLMLILNYESHFYILLLFSWTSFILALRVWYFGLLQYAKLKRFSVILLLLLFFLCSLIFTYKGMMLYYETT